MQGTIHRWECKESYVGSDAGNLMFVVMEGTLRRWGCREPYVGSDAGNLT